MNKLKIKTATQIGTLFVLPVILFYFSNIPIQYNLFVLLAVTLIIIANIIVEKWSLKDLGIRLDNIKKSASWYLLLVVFAIMTIIALARLLNQNTQNIFANVHFQYGFVIISFLQEFLFRAFLIPKLKLLTTSSTLVILANGILFGFIHIIFANPLPLFVLSSLLGVGFAYVYYFHPNLILATVAHSIINFIAVFYCFASFNPNCL